MDLVVAVVGGLAVAVLTALIAADKGQSPLLWFVVGLFLPLFGLVIALLLRPAADVEELPTAADAAGSSPVARSLAARPRRSAHELARLSAENERQTIRQLEALQVLGFADRDATGRWSLTEEGVAAVSKGSSASID